MSIPVITPPQVPVNDSGEGRYLYDDGDGSRSWEDVAGGSLTVRDIDGTPSFTATVIEFTNGTVADQGGGVARITVEPAGTASAAVAAHAGATDPHGDRAYAAGLVTSEATTRAAADAAIVADLASHAGNTSNPHSVTKAQVGLGNVDNTADANKPVSTDTQTALDAKAPLNSPTFTGIPAAPTASGGTNTTQVATTAFVAAAVAAAVAGLLEFKGNLDASANPNYPAADKGDTYYVSVAGKVGGASGVTVAVGDAVVAKADNAGGTEASVGTSWFVLEKNLNGALLTANALSELSGVAATARGNLGLGTGDSPQFTAVNVGNATDTTITRVSAGVIAVEGATVLVSGGALGTPASGTVTNLTGTASININGTVGGTTPAAGTFTTLVVGSATSILIGTAGSAVGSIGFRNATSGTITLAPTTGALGAVTITLPATAGTVYVSGGTDVAVADGGTNLSSYTSGDVIYASGTTTLAKLGIGAAGKVLTSISSLPAWRDPAGDLVTATDGATVTFNLATSRRQIVTLGGSRTLALSNDADGMAFTVILKQDGTGSRTVTWWSGIKWAGGTTPTLTTTAGKYDVFAFVRIASGEYLGFAGSLNH